MSVRASAKWLSVGLYYNEPWENFLLKAVKPYVDIVMQTGIAERFYFQRCWEKGPHIRLWFKGNPTVLKDILEPNIEEYFSHFFDSRPSLRIDPKYPSNFAEEDKWLPNNSLQYFEDSSDMSCFSGSLGLSICEKQYQASSEIILKSMQDKREHWTYDDALSTANKLHLSFAFAVGMDLEEARMFFVQLFENWKAATLSNLQVNCEKTDNTPFFGTVTPFQKIFELQRQEITSFNQALWESLEHGHNAGDESYEEWIQTNINVNIELGLVQEAGKLKLEQSSLQFDPKLNLSKEQEQSWIIHTQLVHLTNNRLGIYNKDEGYLYYSLSKSLENQIVNHKPSNINQATRANARIA